ncbi:MAG: hypothetical protein ACXAB2_11485 [Candidatus Hodarchaeales archaeon]|jgi:hypothetical protein
MTTEAYSIFPKFQGLISEAFIERNLDLVSSVINFAKGELLNQSKINQIEKKLGNKLKGTTFYPGGSSVIFGWSFPFSNDLNVMFKPYYSRELTQLIIHYLTIDEYFLSIEKIEYTVGNLKLSLTTPKVIGVAKAEILSRTVPILLVEEILGESIKDDPDVIKTISQVSRNLAKDGIISDPYPANWKYFDNKTKDKIAYIDLLSSNRLKNVNERIRQLIDAIN